MGLGDLIDRLHGKRDAKTMQELKEFHEQTFGVKPNLKCSGCVKNAIAKVFNLVLHGKTPLVDSVTLEKRREACVGCDYYIYQTNQCGQCGCFLVYKQRLPDETCPHPKGSRWEK